MANLIKNPGFESSKPSKSSKSKSSKSSNSSSIGPNWYGNQVEVVNNPDEAHSGDNYLSMIPDIKIFALLAQDNINMKDGQNYRLSFWANPGNSAKKMTIYNLNFGGEIDLDQLNTWTYYTFDFLAEGSKQLFFSTFYDENDIDNETRLDDISVVKSDSKTRINDISVIGSGKTK